MRAMKVERKDGVWIEARLRELADATSRDGAIWRAAYTPEDRRAKELVSEWMRDAGLAVREDAAGNLCGRLEGDPESGVVLVGSHLDTVRDGGRYDGALGVVGAIAALGNLLAAGKGRPERTIEIVALMEEEGSRYGSSYLGSKAINGQLAPGILQERDATGVTVAEAMRTAGYDPERLAEAERDDVEAFVEMHIEQGPVLDRERVQIGVVERIVGIVGRNVRVRGEQNHAGTTPMRMRLDPVVRVAEAIGRLTAFARAESETATLTVGKIQSYPGMANVVAGEVLFTIDARDGDREKLLRLDAFIAEELEAMRREGFDVAEEARNREMPVALDTDLVDRVAAAARRRGASAIRMNSGAGHDAQIFAARVPTCMLFVPSRGGVSHSPLEYTPPEALGVGLDVLQDLLFSLCWEDGSKTP